MTPAAERLPDIDVEIPSRPEYVGVVRHVMGAVARLGHHSPEFVENAKLAGSEACTNAVMLTNAAGATDRIRVRALLGDERLQIEVSDRGKTAGVPGTVNGAETPAGGFEGDLSLPLLEGLVDELDIEERDGGGNVVRMTLLRDTEEDAG